MGLFVFLYRKKAKNKIKKGISIIFKCAKRTMNSVIVKYSYPAYTTPPPPPPPHTHIIVHNVITDIPVERKKLITKKNNKKTKNNNKQKQNIFNNVLDTIYYSLHLHQIYLIGKNSPCGGSGFPLSLSEWTFTICPTPYNRK